MNARWRRQLTLLPLALVGAPAFLLAAATPALAVTGSITSPNDGTALSSYDAVTLAASLQRGVVNDGGKVTLSLQMPGESGYHDVASASGNTKSMSFSFNPGCPAFPGQGCNGHPGANGTYNVRLSGGDANDTASFSLRVAPSKPTGIAAQATGDRQITVSWNHGPETDILSYDVFTSEGQLLQTVGGDTTSYVVDYGTSGYGGTHGFMVRAARRSCPSCTTDALLSPMSASAAASLTEPSPTPSPDPSAPPASTSPDPGYGSGGGDNPNGTPGGTGGGPRPSSGPSGNTNGNGDFGSGQDDGFSSGSTTKPTAAQAKANQSRSFGLHFKSFAPSLGEPKVPPLPQFAEEAEIDDGYGLELGYGEKYSDVAVGSFSGGSFSEVVENLVSTVFEGDRLWQSIGTALVLLLAAGHLRLWLNTGGRD